jgi:hypothetical protein
MPSRFLEAGTGTRLISHCQNAQGMTASNDYGPLFSQEHFGFPYRKMLVT